MNSGSRPWAPRYFERRRRPRPNVAAAGVAAAAGQPVGGVAALAGQLGDDLLDRSAGRELDDGEGDRHDAEQGRDHQQDAAEDIGAHQASRLRTWLAGARLGSLGARAARLQTLIRPCKTAV